MRALAAYLTVLLCASLVGTAFAQQPPSPQEPVRPELRRIDPGRSIAGASVGSPIQRIFGRFGRPSVTIETAIDMVHVFSRFGITVYARSNVVTAVATTNSLMRIDDNLGVGYRVEAVTGRYGRGFREGSVEGFPGMIYDGRGIAFGLDRQGVAVIMVFRPNTANQVSGLFPGGVGVQPPVTSFPNVAGLRPFSPETNFMSLPGYLRWLVHQASGTWITYAEAKRIVEEQQRAAR